MWLGALPEFSLYEKRKKGKVTVRAKLSFELKNRSCSISLEKDEGEWLIMLFPSFMPHATEMTVGKLRTSYNAANLDSFELFYRSQAWIELRKERTFSTLNSRIVD